MNLETQTQIIGASCNTPAAERIAWLQIYADSLQYGIEREQLENERLQAKLTSMELLDEAMQRQAAYIEVCLCDNTPNGHALQYGWEQCSLHDAVKLASMKGLGVLLHVRNERGEIVPLRGEA